MSLRHYRAHCSAAQCFGGMWMRLRRNTFVRGDMVRVGDRSVGRPDPGTAGARV